jgi:hypothetical protein
MRRSTLAVVPVLRALNARARRSREHWDLISPHRHGRPSQKRQGLVVTDNSYMISSERLEQMNKGGFGGY